MDRIMILKGDCIEVMKAMKPNSVDAVVCDPPYGLEFMGKDWDKLDYGLPQENVWKGRRGKGGSDSSRESGGSFNDRIGINYGAKKHASKKCKFCGHYQFSGTPCKCENPEWEYIYKQEAPSSMIRMQRWHTQWLTEAYRVLRPGGSMLAMGGSRTFHRLACAIEDMGFIIKDTLMWLYGSGFPKAQDLGKMIDKRMGAKRKVVGRKSQSVISEEWRKKEGRTDRLNNEFLDISLPSTDLANYWDGFKVGGIKPAYEPIIWAVKPPEGSYVDNVLKWGVGAVNVDECRVGLNANGGHWTHKRKGKITYSGKLGDGEDFGNTSPKGRFPANVILDEEAGEMLDEQSGELHLRGNKKETNLGGGLYGHPQFKGIGLSESGYAGASRFFYCAKASRGERNAGLEGMKEKPVHWSSGHQNPGSFQAKGTKKEMTNHHPTVKPIKLFEWLIKLVTREGQILLDPFIGSGTTAIAAHNTSRKCVGIEKEDEYLEIAKRRISYWQNQPKQNSLNLGG